MNLTGHRTNQATTANLLRAAVGNDIRGTGFSLSDYDRMLRDWALGDVVAIASFVQRLAVTTEQRWVQREDADLQVLASLFSIEWLALGQPAFLLTPGLAVGLLLSEVPQDARWCLPFSAFSIVLPQPSPIAPFDIIDVLRRPAIHNYREVAGPGATTMSEVVAACYEVPRDRQHDQVVAFRRQDSGHAMTDAIRASPDGVLLDSVAPTSAMWHLIGGFLSYINAKRTADECALEHATGLRAASERFRDGKSATFVMGREIKLPAPATVLRSMGTTGWHTHVRFMVRGHFRNQPVGAGRLQRRLKWIQPHWKGPKDAVEVVQRVYAVSEVKGKK